MDGSWGGTLEIDTFVKTQDDTCVVVHYENGDLIFHGSETAANKIHLHYSAENMHYDACDGMGNRMNLQSTQGDCLFEALGVATGKSAAEVRTEVATVLGENPISSAECKCKASNL